LFIDVKKIYEDSKLPNRANKSDAGADVFYHGAESVLIWAGESRLLPTGIKIAVPSGHVCEVKNKSGIASKKQLLVGACIIDSGYTGEVMVNIHNVGSGSQRINPGEKIAQIIVYPIKLPEFVEIPENEDLYYRTLTLSNRQDGGFGSTGV